VSSPGRQPSSLGTSADTFADISYPKFENESRRVCGANKFAAFSFQFVAKPEQAANATQVLSRGPRQFSRDWVMVSDQEARLITVVVFWEGSQARRSGPHIARWVRALLGPYLDRCLRVENLLAHLPMQQNSQPSSIDKRFIADESIAEEANVCVA
jgi:hypothetical protein